MKPVVTMTLFLVLACMMLLIYHIPRVRDDFRTFQYPHSKSQRKYPAVKSPRSAELDRAKVDTSLLGIFREYGYVDLPSKEELHTLSETHLGWIYYSYIDNINFMCNRKLRMGRVGDGGWEICDDKYLRPAKPCLVYSFGINFDFTFDDDMAKFYQCDVLSFDPSMKRGNHSRSELVHFYNIGISGDDTRNNKWTLRPLHFILKSFSHTDRHLDVLKMDVEGIEWESFRHMIKSGDLSRVRQLLVEFHTLPRLINQLGYLYFLEILVDLEDIGFRKFYSHKNPLKNAKTNTFKIKRAMCYEVHYVNINYLPAFE